MLHIIESFSLVEGRWSRLGAWSGDAKARIPRFDAIELDLAPLWVTKAG